MTMPADEVTTHISLVWSLHGGMWTDAWDLEVPTGRRGAATMVALMQQR